ncbi:hypothetical protein KUTeg_005434 [Tegillarca granosa]|uniref:Clarin-3 n=1 Tax=Tegillarca granosa TaxID=220873 RepID=A0ABQ9FMP5_TEGGR|nr:hypothetical protein KUTeg_005434 [Tegillarca granosa]
MALDTKRQRVLVSLTIFFSFAAIGLIVASFATDNWISANAVKTNNTNDNSTVNQNDGTKKFSANITFGLFRGRKLINYGFGAREQLLDVREEAYNFGLFSFGLWVATIICGALGIVWGLIHVAFAVFNVVAKPIETITGPFGLYVWNGLAFLFTLLAMVLYLVLYFGQYKKNVLSAEDVSQQYTSEDRAYLDFSFYFVVGAVVAFVVNFVLLLLSGTKMRCSFMREAEKVMDNGIILY